jgi:hypothetical protein
MVEMVRHRHPERHHAEGSGSSDEEPDQSRGDRRDLAAHRASETLQAIRVRRLYSRHHHLYGRRRSFVGRSFEHLWPYAGAWSATATLASLPSPSGFAALASFVRGLGAYCSRADSYSDGSAPIGFDSSVVRLLGHRNDRYYDDNAWVGLAALRHYDLTGEPHVLRLAHRLFEFAVSGWSTEAGWAVPGGIRWKEARTNQSRNTCSNAPVAELGAAIYQRTGDDEALAWALRIYHWVRSALLVDDLYLDRIAPDGQVESTIWSYNQGTMIGAGVLLAELTGDRRRYLGQAVATASAAQAQFSLATLLAQGAAFSAVYFRNLLLLDRGAPDPAYRAAAEAYGDAMWDQVRVPSTGLFTRGRSFLNETAPMIEVYALIAGAEPHP